MIPYNLRWRWESCGGLFSAAFYSRKKGMETLNKPYYMVFNVYQHRSRASTIPYILYIYISCWLVANFLTLPLEHTSHTMTSTPWQWTQQETSEQDCKDHDVQSSLLGWFLRLAWWIIEERKDRERQRERERDGVLSLWLLPGIIQVLMTLASKSDYDWKSSHHHEVTEWANSISSLDKKTLKHDFLQELANVVWE